MNNNKEIKKIIISVCLFIFVSVIILYPMRTKIDALEKEKIKLTEVDNSEYKGDCSDDDMDYSDDIVIKIIEKIDPSIDIKFVNKFDVVEDNKSYYRIELSMSGNLDKIKNIENILNKMNLNYNIENMEIKNPSNEKGDKEKYVDCKMTFKVI